MSSAFSFDVVQSGLIIAALFVAGEWFSRRTKAAVPAFLAAGILFAALLWSGLLPADLVERSRLNSLITLGILFVILGMGSTIDFRQLAASWRVVVLAALAYAFELGMILLVIPPLFGKNLALAAIPGGSPVAFMVQERARALGYDNCIVLSVLLLSTQGLVGCPIVSFFVRREAQRLLREGIPGGPVPSAAAKSAQEQRGDSAYMAFFKLYVGAWLADRLASLTGIPVYVLCLVLGVVLAELGFFKRDQMRYTESSAFFFFMLMAVVLNGFSAATPAMLKSMLLPLVCVLALDIVSLTLSSLLLGRLLGFSPWMSVALGFNIMIGFPPNMIISRDIINFYTDDENKRALLMEQIGTRMVIAGFTSTTFLANIMAGLLVALMV
ncbi:MAG: hypothetical protein K6F56_10465 [Oscillospiraceae bacterium]|nr:hypothetical protein [Oscillospiraceae bacterium]